MQKHDPKYRVRSNQLQTENNKLRKQTMQAWKNTFDIKPIEAGV